MSRRALLGAVGGVASLVGCGALLARDGRSSGAATDRSPLGGPGADFPSPDVPDRRGAGDGDGRDVDGPDRRREVVAAGTPDETTARVIEASADGPTAVVVGGMHGDERAGHRAARGIAGWSPERGRLVVLPAAHPTALRAGTRTGGGRDLNRQFPPTADRPPTSRLARAVWRFVRDHDPDLVLDLHSSAGIYGAGDGVGQAIFPTAVSPARERAGRVVAALNDRFDLDGSLAYRVGNTLDGDRPMLVHRVGTALGRPGYILETAERAPIADQVAWHRFAVASLLDRHGTGTARSG